MVVVVVVVVVVARRVRGLMGGKVLGAGVVG